MNRINVIQNEVDNKNMNLISNKILIKDQQIKLIQQDSSINDLEKTVENLKKNIVDLSKQKNTLNKQNDDLKKKLTIKNNTTLSRGGDISEGSLLGVFEVTFYTPYDGSSIGITATGKRAIPGRTVAVDPRVIPLGTKLYVEGLGEVIADDTGGAIKGNIIDYCVSSRDTAAQLGRKHLKVWKIK
jgi:3D (Asp-Asp-Asp) domain-containing protein